MADIEFHDFSAKVTAATMEKAINALREAGGELASQTADASPFDTGELAGSWNYKVNEGKLEATVGSGLENAIWNEFGTGQYALNGNGRKTPWKYVDRKGQGHTTTGKKPQRTFHNSSEKFKPKFKKILDKHFEELNGQ